MVKLYQVGFYLGGQEQIQYSWNITEVKVLEVDRLH